MIFIQKQSDLRKLNNKRINPLITAYIKKYFYFLINQYKATELSQVGIIYFIESKEELQLHNEIGICSPLEQSLFEFSDLLILQSPTESVKLWHCCFVKTNDNAVSLFIPADIIFQTGLENWLKQDYTTRIINIDERN